MRHNEKKNDPHYDSSQGLGWLLEYAQAIAENRQDAAKAIRKRGIDNEAREIVRSYMESRFEEDLRWLRKRENRDDAAKTLRKAQRILQRVSPLLRDHPQNTTIQVKEFRNGRLQEDTYDAAIKLIDYLSRGQLTRIANCLETIQSSAGAAPKYTIKTAAQDLQEFHRGNLGKPDWETIGRIILEEFPDAQKKNGTKQSKGDLTDWIRQLAKRR
jgi:hypothetical protein